jgi:hypothetical protein
MLPIVINQGVSEADSFLQEAGAGAGSRRSWTQGISRENRSQVERESEKTLRTNVGDSPALQRTTLSPVSKHLRGRRPH